MIRHYSVWGTRTSRVIHREIDGNYFNITNNGTPTAGAWLSTGVQTNTYLFHNWLLDKI
ncbi:hypothetical protein [Chryseobacterium sp. SIMBA_038]|uniref:hypothetical protein n=1 Tax=Chryseobacterium sp. SIMBA_038 TaxID=3085780 RepID=UPI00397B7E93